MIEHLYHYFFPLPPQIEILVRILIVLIVIRYLFWLFRFRSSEYDATFTPLYRKRERVSLTIHLKAVSLRNRFRNDLHDEINRITTAALTHLFAEANSVPTMEEVHQAIICAINNSELLTDGELQKAHIQVLQYHAPVTEPPEPSKISGIWS